MNPANIITIIVTTILLLLDIATGNVLFELMGAASGRKEISDNRVATISFLSSVKIIFLVTLFVFSIVGLIVSIFAK